VSADGDEVYLVPLDDRTVLALAPEDEPADSAFSFASLAAEVGPLLTAALRKAGVGGASLYELSPDSQRLLSTAQKNEVGSYFRGVLRREDGKISHQLQLREVTSTPAPSAFDVAAAVQLAAIQSQLSRMEEILNEVALSVERVVSFLELQQRARLLAALRMVQDVHDRASRTGALGDVDWQRLSGAVELELEAQLQAVCEELDRRLSHCHFDGHPKRAAAAMDKLDPKRVAELLELHRLLISGLRRWQELVLFRKISEDEFDHAEAVRAADRLRALHERQSNLLQRVDQLAAAAWKAKPRSNLARLLVDGIIQGSRNDDRDLKTIKSGRERLEASVTASRAARALPPVAPVSEIALKSA
jgi:hypothetical protein